ncbi:HAD family hydrolase [Brucepastera parasyntrophica]|uniref:HAD family hydrolase n=1 Tax=Brucepastera parasyntrophica TaxID=2880008 RepID=UPI003F6FC0EA
MDGILFDTERLYGEAWKKTAGLLGYQMDDRLFLSCVGRNARDTKLTVLKAMGEDFPYDDFYARTDTWVRSYIADYGPPEKPGAREILQFLSDRNIPAGLATSTGSDDAKGMLEMAGFLRFFKACVFGNEAARGKPFPDIFLLARDRLIQAAGFDIPADAIIVFEDSPPGLQAASDAGMKPVFIKDLIDPPREILDRVWRSVPSFYDALSSDFWA